MTTPRAPTTSPAAVPKPAERRRDELTRRVHRAALELFAARGYHGTSVPMILDAAGVSASSLYRLHPSKEALVNAVFLEAKGRLGAALAEALGAPIGDDDPRREAHARFTLVWDRLARFAAEEPVAFRFLELQDHTPYLDGASRAKELSVLAPLALACMDLSRRGVLRADVDVDVMLASLWGALVGLVKAGRLGYLALGEDELAQAREAFWRAFAAPPAGSSADHAAAGSHDGTRAAPGAGKKKRREKP